MHTCVGSFLEQKSATAVVRVFPSALEKLGPRNTPAGWFSVNGGQRVCVETYFFGNNMEYQLDMKLEYPLSDYQVNGYGDESKKRKLSKEESNGNILKLSKDELKKLLEPLTKEQLVALLVDA